MKKIIILLLISLLLSSLYAQKNLLQSGPMVGYSEIHEVMLWVQTTKSAKVKIAYWTKENSTKLFTNTVLTSKKQAFTAHLLADKVKPGQQYYYSVFINNKEIELDYGTSFQTQKIWRYRTDPPDFKFATGSGTYINEEEFDRPGKPFGGDYQIFTSILKKQPDFMLWLGDNVYLRQNEWNTWTGIVHRYTHDRSTPELQKLLASVHNYAIIDDHDFGANNSDGSFWNKNLTEKAFATFWANPSYETEDIKGATTFFSWNDADFFLLDNRYERSPNRLIANDKTMLGKEQLEWLKNSLVSSKANFKFVVMGGQFLNTAGNYETYTNYGFDKERQEIIDFIHTQKIKNVIFLTGDRHFTELSILKKDGFPTIYDLTISPLTSAGSNSGENEKNRLRVERTLISERNFGIIEFTGAYNKRKITIRIYNSEGIELWNKTIEQE